MRSLRIEYSTCSSNARINFSGAMLDRPPFMPLSYMRVNTGSMRLSASFSQFRIGRNGWFAGTQLSSVATVNIASV